MSKARYHLLAALFAFSAFAWGDTFTLKNGEKVEGKILSETDKEITLQIAVTATIKDERVIKKSDLENVVKVPPDEQAWPALSALSLAGESLDPADYTKAITMLGDFLSAFPKSSHAADAKAKLALFEEEKKRVEAGELKINGQWISAAKAHEEQVQIGGSILLARMKKFAATGQYVETLNAFDTLEKSYAGSAAMPDAVEIARRMIPMLKVAAEQRQTQLKQAAVENAARLATAKGIEHQQVEALQKKNQEAVDAAVSAAEHNGSAWLPLSPANDRSIVALLAKCTSEVTRINSLPVDKMRQSLKAAATARAAIETGDLTSAEKALAEAGSTWTANEHIKRLQTKLAEERQKAAEAAKVAEAEKQAKAAEAKAALAAAKAEAEKAKAEAEKAREIADKVAAEAAAAEEEENSRANRARILKYSLAAIAVVILFIFARRKKASVNIEELPQNPPAE